MRIILQSLLPVVYSTNELNIMPNPAKDYFQFKINGTAYEIRIYDLNGKIVLKTSSPKQEQVNISTLTSGFYTVSIICDSKEYRGKLVIK